jgi:hypothetical protein
VICWCWLVNLILPAAAVAAAAVAAAAVAAAAAAAGRPEHIESTWYLKAVTGDPTGHYSGLAAAMMAVLQHSKVDCGYAPIKDVTTGGGCEAAPHSKGQ